MTVYSFNLDEIDTINDCIDRLCCCSYLAQLHLNCPYGFERKNENALSYLFDEIDLLMDKLRSFTDTSKAETIDC